MARQARGLARIEQILDVAAAFIAEHGDAALTMNAVARRAEISPGSLYQFFSSKSELLTALADRYAESLSRGLLADVDAEAVRAATLPQLLDRTLDPLVEFTLRNPGFAALFARLPVDTADVRSLEAIRGDLEAHLLRLFEIRAPGLAGGSRRVATVAVLIVKSVIPALASAEPTERAELLQELKAALVRYLEPHDRA